ncbi:MAG TPA: S1/P1 nuclease [Pyrinomonadaceae bacterium]
MKKRVFAVCLIAFVLLLPQSAFAWNATGHEVVARIAWEKMKPQTRDKLIALLMQAPPDADLASLLPKDSRPLIERQRDLFILAATWADIIRSDEFAERKKKYHHGTWHYTNLFWKQVNGVAVDVPELQPEKINIVERLMFLQGDVVNNADASMRAIDLAWILHLVGDIHQPLHTSARVTELEPTGDQGGNLFKLTSQGTRKEDERSLHGLWDNILNDSIKRKQNETDTHYANRIAARIMNDYPPKKIKTPLKPGDYAAWAQEGLMTAKASLYPSWLKRFQPAPDKYRKQADKIAEPAIALAGYRLAAMLDQLFSN